MKRQHFNLILTLLILSQMVSAGVIYVRIWDMSGQDFKYVQVYENDAISHRYIKSVDLSNASDVEPFTLGTGFNYSILLEPDMMGVFTDIENPDIKYYFMQYFWFISIGTAILFLLVYKIFRRRIR